MIDFRKITVKYGTKTVYENFDFCFDKGVNVVLGKSGCGKTTLLNVAANLVEHTGECVKDGDVAVVFQAPSLAPVSVWKNVDLVLPKGNNTEKIRSVLTLVGLSEMYNRQALSLSGGEKQRLSLAMAFASGRSVWLMDEPFSGLDYGTRVQLRSVLDSLLQLEQKTVLFVTHDIDDALALADRIYILQNKPATITQFVEINAPRNLRSDADAQSLAIKAQLQQLLK